jgi:hypothetical protein
MRQCATCLLSRLMDKRLAYSMVSESWLHATWPLSVELWKWHSVCWMRWQFGRSAAQNCRGSSNSDTYTGDQAVQWALISSWCLQDCDWTPWYSVLIDNHHFTSIPCYHSPFLSFTVKHVQSRNRLIRMSNSMCYVIWFYLDVFTVNVLIPIKLSNCSEFLYWLHAWCFHILPFTSNINTFTYISYQVFIC